MTDLVVNTVLHYQSIKDCWWYPNLNKFKIFCINHKRYYQKRVKKIIQEFSNVNQIFLDINQ